VNPLLNITLVSVLVALLLLVGMLVLLEVGRRLGRRKLDGNPDSSTPGALDAALFALLGLLLAFTFSGAAARFDTRRELVVEETNDIGTAWLRLDLLAPDARDELHGLFTRYVDSRIETYRKVPDFELALGELEKSAELQQRIWKRAVVACREVKDPATTSLVLGALNAMFDITTTRVAASRLHPPHVVYALLFGLALCCALVAGHAMAHAPKPPWLHMISFAGMMAMCVYVILDVEYPRAGLIRIDAFDSLLAELRATMR
jgi:hypothetical protein